jgi:hypothetical protein
VKSPKPKIVKGVFQGSKPAAILFIIYINSIFNLPIHGKLFLYADYIAIVYGACDLETLKRQIEYDLKIIEIRLNNHYLKMNIHKDKLCSLSGKNTFRVFHRDCSEYQT